jgi:hypothetical protein
VTVDVPIPSMLLADDFGEHTQDYALPSKEIPAFMRSFANAIGPSDRYAQVDSNEVAELNKRSQARVKASAEFQELEKKIEKTRDEKGTLRLSELMQEREDAKKNGDKKASDLDPETPGVTAPDEELTPQVQEALGVLADLVELAHRGS